MGDFNVKKYRRVDRDDFGKLGKKCCILVSTPKANFNLVQECKLKPLSLVPTSGIRPYVTDGNGKYYRTESLCRLFQNFHLISLAYITKT